MKLTLIGNIAAVITLGFANITPQLALGASPFEQQEVNQEEFIAIARPYGKNKYDLLILRQIPGQRTCWQEKGSEPVLVEPLLLNFDFTGSCQRNTDSNGYSIRVAQQDYGLDYLLRLKQQSDELLLVGTHRTNPSEPEIIIGRTHGMAPGFLKIHLDPGWRFTRRAYNGQTLGHVYLTADDTTALENPTPTTIDNTASIPNSNVKADKPIAEVTFTAQQRSPAQSSQPLPPTQTNKLPPPPTPKSTTPETPPPLPSFSELPPLAPPTSKNTNNVVPPPRATPPQPPQKTSSQGYRVIVAANNTQEQSRVRSLYPEAFTTSYQGRSMLQVGLFSSRDNAEKAHQSLESAGLNAIIIP